MRVWVFHISIRSLLSCFMLQTGMRALVLVVPLLVCVGCALASPPAPTAFILPVTNTPTLAPSATITASATSLPTSTFTPPNTATASPSSTRTLTATPLPTLKSTSTPDVSVSPQAINILTRTFGGAPMVLIPAGEFVMGSANDPLAFGNESPQHLVSLDAFWMDQYEVTNARYAQCVAAKACPPPAQLRSNTRAHYYDNAEFADFPVIYVRWVDANAFCTWTGKRLPGEAEWEKAARGPNGNLYPWGNVFDSTRVNSAEGGPNDTVRIGSYPNGVSIYGAFDMAGNVSEWVNDYYQSDYYRVSPALNPPGPLSDLPRSESIGIMRGGAWLNDRQSVRSAFRLGYWQRHNWYEAGFRCAMGETGQ